MTRLPRSRRRSRFRQRFNHVLDLWHSDVCGPIQPATFDNERYCCTFIDDATGFIQVELTLTRSEVFNCFQRLETQARNFHGRGLRMFLSDNAGEYTSDKFTSYCINNGIVQLTSAAYTPEENGVAERVNRTLLNAARAP